MSALQHLSPDVLEVVRDVARQEDSFLLRVQGVPLRAFMGDGAPRVGPRAPFLSAAERHLLEHCREESAYLFELALFMVVTSGNRPDATQIATVHDPLGALTHSFEASRLSRQCVPVGGLLESRLINNLKSPQELLDLDWRVLARSAMTLRVSSTALTNSALAMIRCGMLDDSQRALRRVHALRPGPWPDYYATVGYERFMRGAYEGAGRAYTRAWRLSNDETHASCALLNQWLSNSDLMSDADAFARSLDDAGLARVSARLRGALSFSLGSTFPQALVHRASQSTRRGWSQTAIALIQEVLR